VRVPALIAGVELAQLVPAFREANRLHRLRGDAVLVPGDVPRDGDDELTAHAGQRDDARPRLAEALGNPADGPAVVARVEDVGGLDHLLLGWGQPSEDRLRHHWLVRRLAPRIEERGQPAAAAALVRNGRGSRAPLLDPAVVDRELDAERADVDEVLAVR
jgi:hypothetical protein